MCLDTLGNSDGKKLGLHRCHGHGGNQMFAYLKSNRIVNHDNAVDADPKTGQVHLTKYQDKMKYQEWLYNDEESTITNVKTGKCLTMVDVDGSWEVLLKKCDDSMAQKWSMNEPWR